MRGFDVTKNGVNRIIGLTVRFMRVGQAALFWWNMVIWRIGEYVCGDSSFAIKSKKRRLRLSDCCHLVLFERLRLSLCCQIGL